MIFLKRQRFGCTFHYEKGGEGVILCVLRNVDNQDECLKNP
jgi:hypothetical protein